jgi:hypothetical protein
LKIRNFCENRRETQVPSPSNSWMAGSSPAMTRWEGTKYHFLAPIPLKSLARRQNRTLLAPRCRAKFRPWFGAATKAGKADLDRWLTSRVKVRAPRPPPRALSAPRDRSDRRA